MLAWIREKNGSNNQEVCTVKKLLYGIYVFLVIAAILAIMVGIPASLFFDLMLKIPWLIAALVCTIIGGLILSIGSSFIFWSVGFRRRHNNFGGQGSPFYHELMIIGSSLSIVGITFLAFAGWRCLVYWGGPS